ncbi:MAG: class II aldolase [Spirochaetes bacterium]|nr:class II aldolase [Spirochaetota bacterium]
MEQALKDLILISRSVGRDAMLVQGGGGNTSVKTPDGKSMFVKASGTSLKEMDAEKGWRKVDLASVRHALADGGLARMPDQAREAEILRRLLDSCVDGRKDGSRPSVESHVHSLLGTCVVHVHAMGIGAFVHSKNGKSALLKRLSGRKLPPLWIPYCNPGFTLAVKARDLAVAYEKKYGAKPELVLQGKHGIFVGGPTPQKTLALLRQVVGDCLKGIQWKAPRPAPKPAGRLVREAQDAIQGAVWKILGQEVEVRHVWHPVVADLLAQKNAKALVAPDALSPDDLIYTHGRIVWMEKASAAVVERELEKGHAPGKKPPRLYLVKGLGLFVATLPATAQAVIDTALMVFSVRRWATKLGGVVPLAPAERNFILNWEVENYRAKLIEKKK